MFGSVELRPVDVVLLPRSRRRIQLDPSIDSIIGSSTLQALIIDVFAGPPRHISANSGQGLPPCNASPSRLSSDLFQKTSHRIRINAEQDRVIRNRPELSRPKLLCGDFQTSNFTDGFLRLASTFRRSPRAGVVSRYTLPIEFGRPSALRALSEVYQAARSLGMNELKIAARSSLMKNVRRRTYPKFRRGKSKNTRSHKCT
ncbi:hypothetical protein DFH08DRAFT_861816 [Mycena albidolilacea]|uniref:Uncharacterized protein n=1 Tax=Mycena albidolilacea TaxID=1033008 RepID=A0AAD7A774_9AGAR|nr:hypothetical protein DFH08DRAFT_861816 [Mycena albidolilacea]